MTTETYSFVSLIGKTILLGLAFVLLVPAADKTQYFVHLSFNFTLESINGILSDLQKLLKYFNSTKIVAVFEIPFALSASVFPNNLALYLKDLNYYRYRYLHKN